MDFSPKMFKLATDRLSNEIKAGKVFLNLCSVTKIPYENKTFDKIMHCHCFFFWPEMDPAIKELHRVIKPGGLMVTAFDHSRVVSYNQAGLGQFGNTDPDRYTNSLKKYGFQNIHMEIIQAEKPLTAIFATADK